MKAKSPLRKQTDKTWQRKRALKATHEEQPEVRQATAAKALRIFQKANASRLSLGHIPSLQQTTGNRALQRMLTKQSGSPLAVKHQPERLPTSQSSHKNIVKVNTRSDSEALQGIPAVLRDQWKRFIR